jgi:uncharacterized protein YdeI (YjbR/CyaY-like superfamily)
MTARQKQEPAAARRSKLPANLKAALARMSPSHRKEYMDWIISAKRPETRAQRIARAVAMIAQRGPQA